MTDEFDSASITIRIAQPDDIQLLSNVAAQVFDWSVEQQWCEEFFADPRHHMAIAIHQACVIGIATGVHYVHPDKRPELYVNEVGVTPQHRNRGTGKRLVQCLFAHGVTLGCHVAWVLTESKNREARALYESLGGVESAHAPVYYSFRITTS